MSVSRAFICNTHTRTHTRRVSSGVVEITYGQRLANVAEPLRLDLLEVRSHIPLDQKQALSQGDWSAYNYATASSSDEVGSPRGALHS